VAGAVYQTIVFDLDGTLVNTLPGVYRAYEYAVAPYRPAPTRAEIDAVLGGPGRRGLEILLPPGAPVDEAWERLWEYAYAHRDEVDVMPHARELLIGLRDAGRKVALWTGRDRESTELILERYGLAEYFYGVVCGDDLPTHKPDPQGLLLLMEKAGATPQETLLAGDSIHDVRAGLRAGVFTVAVGPRAHLLEEKPPLVVRDLQELHRFLLAPQGRR